MRVYLINSDCVDIKSMQRRTMRWLRWCKELSLAVCSKRATKLRKLLYNQEFRGRVE